MAANLSAPSTGGNLRLGIGIRFCGEMIRSDVVLEMG